MGYQFPFEVPADLTALGADEFAAFAAQVRTHAEATLADDNASAEALVETRTLFASVTTEETRRTELAQAAQAARQELAAGLAPATQPTPTPAPEPTPAPAPAPAPEPTGTEPVPAVTAGAGGTGSTLDPAPVTEEPRYASMTASSDAPGTGGALATFADAGALIERRLSTYSSSTSVNRAARRAPGRNRFVIGGRSLTRHGNVAFRREFPEELTIRDGKDALAILDYATKESRLPGGSLVASMEAQVKAGKSLTAAVGWCAPSETIYDLCELETMDGLLDIAEVQATRGGFFVPENGGPDFSTIYDSIGDEGDVILSEYDVINGADKVCVEIPCPEFVEVRLDVAYVCITGSLLQRRGYPEAVTRFSRGAMVALAHKINESVISRIVAQSGAPVTIPTIAGSDDAASQLLSAVELAIEDMRYRHRMGRSATMEVVLPAWSIAPIRAALARRRGVMAINVSNSEILSAFTTRGAVPRFVYDWQDAYSGLAGGPGASTAITEFPDEVQFLVYPAGTWVKPVRDVVNLDTVYDNALLTQNQYTALFAEDGFNVLKMCADSRLYTSGLDPAGIVGCCTAS
jgi:hypothetical protein